MRGVCCTVCSLALLATATLVTMSGLPVRAQSDADDHDHDCVGVPNQHVCVSLSPAAASGCGPSGGWPLPTGPSQGFTFLMDDGRGGAPQPALTFTVDVPGRPITFELVDTPPSANNTGGGGFACHPFAIVSAATIGGCARRGIGCALGVQSGVLGSVPAYAVGSRITVMPELNITYGYQSTFDTHMGGTIIISNQPPPPGPVLPGVGATDGDGDGSSSLPLAGPIAGAVVGAVVVCGMLGFASVYARRHGYWSGVCAWNSNPNLAATTKTGGASAAAAAEMSSASSAAAGTTHLAPGDSSSPGAAVAIDVQHIALHDETVPFPHAATAAPATGGAAASTPTQHGAGAEPEHR